MRKVWFPAVLSLIITGVIHYSPQAMAKNDNVPAANQERVNAPPAKVQGYTLEKPVKATTSATTRPKASPQASPKLVRETTRTATPAAVRANNGAQFFVQDPASGVVTLVTPSGNTHTLNLPQQAINNMMRNGLLQVGSAASVSGSLRPADVATRAGRLAAAAIETVDEQGNVVIKQALKQTKRLFGFIPVNINVTATINEMTGDTRIQPNSIFGRILSFLSIE